MWVLLAAVLAGPAAASEFKGRVVMVTGAGSGIGRAVSLALAQAGAEVILLGRTVRKLEGVHAEIQKLDGPEASIVPLDLERALAADYEAVAAAIEKRYGRLDGLLHNAALLGTLTPIEVKWSEKPSVQDARHLLTFMDEHPKLAKQAYIVCRCPRPMQLHEKVTALPWFCL